MSSPPLTPATGARGPREWWQGIPPRRRRLLKVVLGLAVVLVLVVSALLARFLSVENAERSDELALVQAEVRGDLTGMLAQLDGCSHDAKCLALAKTNASNLRLRRSGAVKILQIEAPTAYSPFGATGKTRLAWTVIGSLPVVQCVQVSRTGNFLSGIHVHLLEIGAPISGEGKCRKETTLEKEEEEATAVELGTRPGTQ
ncbi:MAG TPA: hypothetical protein VHT29_14930 [Solirubrobacteraceae bacterium]|nr:hypothetical protein [Solirubrobacteraceae bacterium]